MRRSLLLDLLYPPKCVFCGALLEDARALMCPQCLRELPWLRGAEAEQEKEFISLCVSPLRYQEKVRDSIRRYKFSGMFSFCQVYGELTARCVRERLAGRYDLISWVPVSRKRRRERGYDQAFLLARETARALEAGAPVSLLEKVRNNPPQSGLEEQAARRANVMGAYRVSAPRAAAGGRILLIDDVVTTGETLSECARTLRLSGARDVVCAALARAR